MLTVWTFLILAALSFFSMYVLIKKMNVINVLGSYFFSNVLITNTGVIINLNLKLTKQDPSNPLIFWTQKIPELSLKPALLLWMIYILFSNRSLISKGIYALICLIALVSIELFFVHIQYLQWVKWNVFYTYLRYGLILVILAVYSFYLQKLINKNKEVNTI
ncbi:hypothetical protein AWM70_19565 [Paenibacillus yonginensis]|uniref:Uncharacterized protein n=1 Tax=Paenibacillus yonginensis TaxID=1462996 RepID=A0A1B1N517_9BACL|nr:hypothetical protein AWM70_19565 [Paenibacillus yonginensis]